MTWLARDGGVGADYVQCDVCARRALSRFDLRRALPPGWRATAVRGRHVCPACGRRFAPRIAR